MTQTSARIEYRDVTVQFGATTAVDRLDLALYPGEIVGLLGHNGAGKSTLMNVTTGAVRATAGTIAIDGAVLAPNASPQSITEHGVTIIHQEPALIGSLTVMDNLFLRQEGVARRRDREAAAHEALGRLGAPAIDLAQPVATLPAGHRQIVDLARGFLRGDVRLLLLDEPTASLGNAETARLHDLIRELAAGGTTVVYISHRLPDINDVCSRIVVMREGGLALDEARENVSTGALSDALAPGVEFEMVPTDDVAAGDPRITVDVGAGIEVRPGEVVGLFGVAHGDQFAILDGLFGLQDPPKATLAGRRFTPRSPRDAIRKGVHLVPADRDHEGLLLAMPAIDNVFLPWTGRSRGSASHRQERYERMRSDLSVRGPSGAADIGSFSGGNRQKHLIGRWLYPVAPRVLLLAQPTQGVDLSSKQDIRQAVWELARSGVAVLVASAETDEIASICHIAYVLGGGRVEAIRRTPARDFESDLLSTLLDLSAEGNAA